MGFLLEVSIFMLKTNQHVTLQKIIQYLLREQSRFQAVRQDKKISPADILKDRFYSPNDTTNESNAWYFRIKLIDESQAGVFFFKCILSIEELIRNTY